MLSLTIAEAQLIHQRDMELLHEWVMERTAVSGGVDFRNIYMQEN
jgi:hypothetical protein